MLKAIKKTKIYEEVVAQIQELIREGKFKPGDQLPAERELAETFKVSRASVREALRALESQRLVVSRTGAGTFIADLPMESLVTTLAGVLVQEKDGLADIFEVRKLIEPEIAALAAERAGTDEIARLAAILKRQREDVKAGDTGVEADAEFHFAIGQATQNPALERLVASLMEILGHSREESLQTPARRVASLESHQKIFAAIRAHDAGRARKAMLNHIEQVEGNVFATGRKEIPARDAAEAEERRIS